MSSFQSIAIASMGASVILGAALSTTTAEQPIEHTKGFKRLEWAPPSHDTLTQEPAKLPMPMVLQDEKEQPPAIEITQHALEQNQGARLSEVNEGDMRAITDKVLSGLPTIATSEAPAREESPTNDEMLETTNRVLEALNALDRADSFDDVSVSESAAQDLRVTLSELVAQAQLQGDSNDYVGQLLDEAIARRNTAVPNALQDGSGRLNTAALLASIAAAESAKQAQAAADPYLSAIEAEGATTLVNRGDRLSTGSMVSAEPQRERFITVRAGDTLGAIAIAAYGDALLYPRIFQANQDILRSPNDLSIGQRLRIPN
ncbi:MAG: LysM peptidoglycan-binding domain-containing protein [Rhodobacteraceae bacterium]|nr:LysM peptidoglycan-binding domain-containing protein [Paracoccaceae bacterium]